MDAARAGHLDCVKELATEADLSLTDKMNRGIVEEQRSLMPVTLNFIGVQFPFKEFVTGFFDVLTQG